MEVYQYNDYKDYLQEFIALAPKSGRGLKSAWAQAINCQSGYISHVLGGEAHFSIEQAERLNLYLNHTEDEAHFFILLVGHTRAGTVSLKKYYYKQMQSLKDKRLIIKERLKVTAGLDEKGQNIYYSAWYYSAIHMACGLKKFNTREDIVIFFRLSKSLVANVIEFLLQAGLLQNINGQLTILESRIHIPHDSPLILKHHSNWRFQAIRSLESGYTENLHFSSVIGIADSDIIKFKEILIDSIEQSNILLNQSKEENLHSLNIDFFKI